MSEVNYPEGCEGLGSPECSKYVPTKHELRVLGAYWLNVRYFIELLSVSGEPVDGRDGATHHLALERLDLMADDLGPDLIRDTRDRVEPYYRKILGERGWEICMTGSPEEKERFYAEFRRESAAGTEPAGH
jgi:hypothetical protein